MDYEIPGQLRKTMKHFFIRVWKSLPNMRRFKDFERISEGEGNEWGQRKWGYVMIEGLSG